MRHHNRIDLGVVRSISQYVEVDSRSWSPLGNHHTTPFGSAVHDGRDVLGRDYECELLECLTVGIDLRRESVEIVLGALYLIPVDAAINNGHVDTTPSVREAKFVDHERIGMRFGVSQSFGV